MTAVYPLQGLEIDGFRGFKDFSLSGLGGVNVLVGGNNSGKTSLLEALYFVCQPTHAHTILNMAYQRDLGDLDESLRQSMIWFFDRKSHPKQIDEHHDLNCTFKVTPSSKHHLNKLAIHYQEYSVEPSADEVGDARRPEMGWRGIEIKHTVSWGDFQGIFHGDETYNFRFTDGLRVKPKIQTLAGREVWGVDVKLLRTNLFEFSRRLIRSLSALSDEQMKEVCDSLKFFDNHIKKISIKSLLGGRPSIYFEHATLGDAPVSMFGDGMQHVLLMAAHLLALPPGGVLLIDEAEAGIHVKTQPKFFAWLMNAARQRQVQVFMTTHSLEALDAMLMGLPDPADESDLVVYQLKRDGQDIRSKRFAGDLLHRLRFDRGLDLR